MGFRRGTDAGRRLFGLVLIAFGSIGLVLAALMGALIPFAISASGEGRDALPGLTAGAAVLGPIGALLLWIGVRLRRARRPDYVCRSCGYDLRGNPAARRCPECGGGLN